MEALNRSWIDGDLDGMRGFLHPKIVMQLPGFSEEISGVDAVIQGFRDMVENASVRSFEARSPAVHVVDRTAIAAYAFTTVYRRDGARYESSGWDLWVFAKSAATWLAIWRTMIDVRDDVVDPDPHFD